MNLPLFALTIPRPWVWLVAHGYRRDWLLIETDPAALVGQFVALHSAAAGDAEGWRRFDVYEAPADRKRVNLETPHNAIVGVARVARADRRADGWHLALEEARPLEALGQLEVEGCEWWPLPARTRAQLRTVLTTRRAA